MVVRSSLAAAVLFLLVTVGACSGGSPASHGSAAKPPAAPVAVLPAAAVAHAAPGWPLPKPAYLGRYTMTWSSDRSFASSGRLTLFMRSITKPKAMIVPSGIISAFGDTATTVLYLTKFGHLGSRATADVNLGLYTSSPVGTAQITSFSVKTHTLTLVFSAPGNELVQMRFSRYSADPHP